MFPSAFISENLWLNGFAVGFSPPFRNENRCRNERRNDFSYSPQRDERRSGVYPHFHGVVMTSGDVTKTASVTLAVTTFPLVLNDIRSVTAFTPIFRSNVLVNKPFQIPSGESSIPSEKTRFRRIPSGTKSMFSTTLTERQNHPHIRECSFNQRGISPDIPERKPLPEPRPERHFL